MKSMRCISTNGFNGLGFCTAALVLAFNLSACATTYQPQRSPRVAVVADSISVGYVKEGRYYSGAGFGGELVTAVQGVPAAESEARAYRNWTTASVIIDFAALGLWGIGLPVNHAVTSSDDSRRNVDVALLASGGVLLLVGLGLQGVARTHAYNAANAYNDAVETPTPPPTESSRSK